MLLSCLSSFELKLIIDHGSSLSIIDLASSSFMVPIAFATIMVWPGLSSFVDSHFAYHYAWSCCCLQLFLQCQLTLLSIRAALICCDHQCTLVIRHCLFVPLPAVSCCRHLLSRFRFQLSGVCSRSWLAGLHAKHPNTFHRPSWPMTATANKQNGWQSAAKQRSKRQQR